MSVRSLVSVGKVPAEVLHPCVSSGSNTSRFKRTGATQQELELTLPLGSGKVIRLAYRTVVPSSIPRLSLEMDESSLDPGRKFRILQVPCEPVRHVLRRPPRPAEALTNFGSYGSVGAW